MENTPMPPEQPATKADVSALKSDINALAAATKADVAAIRADLAGFATKADISALRGDLAGFADRLSKAIIASKAELEAKIDKHFEGTLKIRSNLFAACDFAVLRADRVYTDQILTRDRLDLLERRVTGLEGKPKRRRLS